MSTKTGRTARRGRVQQVAPPAEARARSTLAHVDYEDCFVTDVPRVRDRTAEEWARAALEEAPAALRRSLRSAWRTLGMRVGPERGDGFVLGWSVRRSEPDVVLLGGTSRLGMQAEPLLERAQPGLDRPDTGVGTRVPTLRDRLPADLRDTPRPEFAAVPLTSLYLLEDEFAAEVANQTMHGVLHLGRVADGAGRYRVQMAVLVKPN